MRDPRSISNKLENAASFCTPQKSWRGKKSLAQTFIPLFLSGKLPKMAGKFFHSHRGKKRDEFCKLHMFLSFLGRSFISAAPELINRAEELKSPAHFDSLKSCPIYSRLFNVSSQPDKNGGVDRQLCALFQRAHVHAHVVLGRSGSGLTLSARRA